MLTIRRTGSFKDDLKRCIRRGYPMEELNAVVTVLASGGQLDAQYLDHPLSGKLKDYRECHIRPDWLLMYCISGDCLILTLLRTGTHADLFSR